MGANACPSMRKAVRITGKHMALSILSLESKDGKQIIRKKGLPQNREVFFDRLDQLLSAGPSQPVSVGSSRAFAQSAGSPESRCFCLYIYLYNSAEPIIHSCNSPIYIEHKVLYIEPQKKYNYCEILVSMKNSSFFGMNYKIPYRRNGIC